MLYSQSTHRITVTIIIVHVLFRKEDTKKPERMNAFVLFIQTLGVKQARTQTQTYSQTNNFKTSEWQMECVFSQSFKLKTNENTRLFAPCCFFVVISVSHLSSFFNAKNWTIPLEYHCLHSCKKNQLTTKHRGR